LEEDEINFQIAINMSMMEAEPEEKKEGSNEVLPEDEKIVEE
jgi:hypothetical protein